MLRCRRVITYRDSAAGSVFKALCEQREMTTLSPNAKAEAVLRRQPSQEAI